MNEGGNLESPAAESVTSNLVAIIAVNKVISNAKAKVEARRSGTSLWRAKPLSKPSTSKQPMKPFGRGF